jgi:hypothetical protein
MAGKSYIKVGAYDWDRIKKMYIKTGGQTWSAIRKAYVKTNAGLWKKVFDTTSNRPFIEGNDIPKLRLNTFRTNSTFPGTVGPVVEAPPVQQMGPPTTTPTTGWPSSTVGNHLWGYNGDWVSGNGSTITYAYDWLFSVTGDLNYVEKEFLATSSTGRRDMITNSSTHLGRDDGDYFDKNWLIFRVRATNSAGNAAAQALPVYIVRQRPSGTISMPSTGVDVPETLSANFTYKSDWYNKPDLYDSRVEWFAIDSIGDALTTNNRVAVEELYNVSVTGTTVKSGTSSHYATIPSKIYVVRLTLNNSNTQNPVVPVVGFIPTASFTVESSTSPGSALEVTDLSFLDYYNNEGTDNRGYIPVGGLVKFKAEVQGVDGSTTYRIRYRMYNWQNSSYYGMDGTNYGASASSAWTTRTGSNSSSGFGGTLINQITVSGTTATLIHNEVISSSLFGATTYDGGNDRWQIEIEVSALKNSIRKYYADLVGGAGYYISRPAANLLLSSSPEPAQTNTNVTLSGSIGALGGGTSHPRQYKVNFGDGTDSGWLPAGSYSYGTTNPSFQITKQYSAVGEYYPYFQTIPDYSTGGTTVTVSAALSAPSPTGVSWNGTSFVLSYTGGSGPWFQSWYRVNDTSYPADGTSYDSGSATQSTSTIVYTPSFTPTPGNTYYFWVRSAASSTANTTGTVSSYSTSYVQVTIPAAATSPTSITATNNGSYDTVYISWSGASNASYYRVRWVGYQDTSIDPATYYDKQITASNSTSGSWNWGPGDPDKDGVVPYSGVAYYYHVSSSANGTTWSPYTVSATAVGTVPAPVKLPTPTGINATDDRTDGVNVTWNAVSGAAYYGVWYGAAPSYNSNPDFNFITGTSYLDVGIAAGGNRDYYVQAFATNNPTGTKSDWGGPNNGTRIAAPVKLSTPTGVNATDDRTDGVNITWNAVSGASYYGVWYGPAPSYDALADFGGNRDVNLITGTSYLDTAVSAGNSRDYYVQAYASGNPTGTKSDWGGPNNGLRVAAAVITYGPCTPYGSPYYTTSSYDCYGDYSYAWTDNYYYHRKEILSNGVWNGSYDYGCPNASVRSYGSYSQVNGQCGYTPPVAAPTTPTGVSLSGSGAVSWNASSGSTSYDIQVYTASSSSGATRQGPFVTTGISGTSYQLGSQEGYTGGNNYARVQVRGRNSAGAVSTYGGWVPSNSTYT